MSVLGPEIAGKRIELVKALAPTGAAIAYLVNPSNPAGLGVGQRLPVVIADDEAGVRLLGGPGRREVSSPIPLAAPVLF